MIDNPELRRRLRHLQNLILYLRRSWGRRLQPLITELDRSLRHYRDAARSMGAELPRHLESLAERVRPRILREDLTDISKPSEELVHGIAAAYTDHDRTLSVVADLVRAGFHPSSITVIRPYRTTPPAGNTRMGHLVALLERPVRHPGAQRLAELMAQPSWWPVFGALLMGAVMSLMAVVWLAPDNWLAFAGLGVIAGIMSGVAASAIGALEAPELAPDYLGAPAGAATVEVETTNAHAAQLAKNLIVRHGPARLQTTTWLAPNPLIWHKVPPETPDHPAPDRGLARQPRPGRSWRRKSVGHWIRVGDPRL